MYRTCQVRELLEDSAIDAESFGSAAASTHSSILWMVALTGPISMTWGQICAMKRPSEVPPVVDNSLRCRVRRGSRCAPRRPEPSAVRKGGRQRPRDLVVEPMPLQHRFEALLQPFRGAGGREAEVERISTVPGMTLVAPVPPLMFEICQVVGGKWALPSSQTVAASSAIAGGHVDRILARCG